MLTKFERQLKNLIKRNVIERVVRTYKKDVSDSFNFQIFITNTLKKYCNVRLKLLHNENIAKIEKQLIVSAVKTGVKAANSKYDLHLTDEQINKTVEYVIPEVCDDLHKLRIVIFEKIEGRLPDESK